MKFRKILKVMYLLIFSLILIACENDEIILPEEPNISSDTLEIYAINDFHGALLRDDSNGFMGFSSIANYLKNNEPENQHVAIASGDIFQGELLSNYYYGEPIIEVMNHLGFDAFTLGNHEFDWGIEEVTKYFDPSYEGLKANFDLLGANVIDKQTNEIIDFVKPYTIVHKNDLKIGIIGVMGDGLETSISGDKVQNYQFTDAFTAIKKYSRILRADENVDVIIVSVHGANSSLNQRVASLSGLEYVDAMFNAHTHAKYERFYSDANRKVELPVIQSESKGTYLGNITLRFDEHKKVKSYTAKNMNHQTENLLKTEDQEVLSIINKYYKNLEQQGFYDMILPSEKYFDKASISIYLSYLMQNYTAADLAIHNLGGTRETIAKNEKMSLAKIYQIMPFDNEVIVFNLYGSELKKNISRNEKYIAYHSPSALHTFLDDQIYRIATNRYVFESTNNYTFKDKAIGAYTIADKTMIPMFLDHLNLQKEEGQSYFNLNLSLSFPKQSSNITQIYKRSNASFFLSSNHLTTYNLKGVLRSHR